MWFNTVLFKQCSLSRITLSSSLANSMPERGQDDASQFYLMLKTNSTLFFFLKSQLRPIFIGARSFSTLRVQVVLGRPFGLFRPAAGFLIAASKALKRSSSGGKLWQRDRINKTDLNIVKQKNHRIGIALVGANCSLFSNSVAFQKCIKAPTEKYAYLSTTTNFLDF